MINSLAKFLHSCLQAARKVTPRSMQWQSIRYEFFSLIFGVFGTPQNIIWDPPKILSGVSTPPTWTGTRYLVVAVWIFFSGERSISKKEKFGLMEQKIFRFGRCMMNRANRSNSKQIVLNRIREIWQLSFLPIDRKSDSVFGLVGRRNRSTHFDAWWHDVLF